jgi:hypothetical protein
MSKYYLRHAEFYITNVCNLTCPDCRSFNNHNFKGHYEFDASLLAPWKDHVDLGFFAILGGEPTLHPRLGEWMKGVRELFPDTPGVIISNGVSLSRIKDLHKLAAEYRYDFIITMHSKNLRELIASEIFSTFGDCRIIEMKKFRDTDLINRIILETNLGVKIKCDSSQNFQVAPYKNNQFEFYNSDPDKAHANCHINGCHQMVNGKLYKCGFVATAGEFLKQKNLPANPLISAYSPLTVNDIVSQTVLEDFQYKSIPQCSLCHEGNPLVSFTAGLKNKKIFNIQNLTETKQTMELQK